MIWSIFFTTILVVMSIKIHAFTLNRLSKIKSKKFIYSDFVKISSALIGSHLIHIILFAYYYYFTFHAYHHLNLFGGNIKGTFFDFFYYSINCYTTLGIGDIFANGPLRLATGLESLIGLILIAWTAAFMLNYFLKAKR